MIGGADWHELVDLARLGAWMDERELASGPLVVEELACDCAFCSLQQPEELPLGSNVLALVENLRSGP